MPHSTFSSDVIDWQKKHGRKNLPWQKNRNAYRVWVSEIMLQQTQVATVIPYYQRFMAVFPSLTELANAPQDQVLQLWTGLGYYARARNMHKTAQLLVAEQQGQWPQDLQALIDLPGIGRSTAGAILSLGMNKKGVILDGNVKRVLARYHCVEGWPDSSKTNKLLWGHAETYTPNRGSKTFNQGMMDLGASLCSKKAPQCSLCPLQQRCEAFATHSQEQFPHTKPKVKLPQKTTSMLMIIRNKNQVLLQQRPPQGIWGGLWGFPECDVQDQASIEEHCVSQLGVKVDVLSTWRPIKHTFSHFQLTISPIELSYKRSRNQISESSPSVWHHFNETPSFGVATPIKKILAKLSDGYPTN
ncbi:MAG: A/G-specific adenine glycosylase [Gammaproteobacteria bacterium]|nr:MAG: A/G-specific adenine glycosylase [Gammaproteobacteria bacterium]